MLRALRIEKERLYREFREQQEGVSERQPISPISPPSEAWSACFDLPKGAAPPELDLKETDRVLAARIEEITDSTPPGEEPRCLRACLQKAGVKPTEVRWLFLTGGSNSVHQIGESILRFLRTAGNTDVVPVAAPAKDAPINVARGTAVRYAYTIEGSLPCRLVIEVDVPTVGTETFEMLPRHEMPGGAPVQELLPLAVGMAVDLRVIADFGDVSGCVVATTLDLSKHESVACDILMKMRYARTESVVNRVELSVEAQTGSANGPEVLLHQSAILEL